MRRCSLFTFATCVSLVPAVWAGPQIVGFDDAAEGRLPAGWVSELTHVGGPPRWEVVRDKTAPSAPKVLAQLSVDATSARYPLAILDGVRMTDGKVSVRFRPVSGKEDQAAGIAFRLQDRDNYYIVRANALENNVVLYKVENGKRTALAPTGMPSGTYGVKHPVPGGVWSTLSVEFRGGRLQVAMSGAALFEVEDSTFLRSGRIGLWTKADSVTHFDDFAYEPSASHSN